MRKGIPSKEVLDPRFVRLPSGGGGYRSLKADTPFFCSQSPLGNITSLCIRFFGSFLRYSLYRGLRDFVYRVFRK